MKRKRNPGRFRCDAGAISKIAASQSQMTTSDPYEMVDPVLLPWAKSHGINIVRYYRDDPVRSFWVFDRLGNQRAQLWLNPPDADGDVTVCDAAFDASSSSKWGAREERHASLATLAETLESLRLIVFGWAGPGAFTSP